jgi:hypothetical protein
MREVFELSRIRRVDAPCGGYAHHDGSKGSLQRRARSCCCAEGTRDPHRGGTG